MPKLRRDSQGERGREVSTPDPVATARESVALALLDLRAAAAASTGNMPLWCCLYDMLEPLARMSQRLEALCVALPGHRCGFERFSIDDKRCNRWLYPEGHPRYVATHVHTFTCGKRFGPDGKYTCEENEGHSGSCSCIPF